MDHDEIRVCRGKSGQRVSLKRAKYRCFHFVSVQFYSVQINGFEEMMLFCSKLISRFEEMNCKRSIR